MLAVLLACKPQLISLLICCLPIEYISRLLATRVALPSLVHISALQSENYISVTSLQLPGAPVEEYVGCDCKCKTSILNTAMSA